VTTGTAPDGPSGDPQRSSPGPVVPDEQRRGLAYGVSAYALWGMFPLYWVLFGDWPALEVLAHRVTWSLVFCLVVLAVAGRLGRLRWLSRHDAVVLVAASALISVNWGVFIWASGNGRVVEASLGYFITPLINVVLGVVVKGERLRRLQVVVVGIAALGVGVLTWHVGSLPWVALVLATTFGLYGLAKSSVQVPALEGLALETAIASLPAIGILVAFGGDGILASGDPLVTGLALAAGPVTAIPLLLFAGATRRLPLATVGLLQYLAPTLQFFVGVAVLDEPFDTGRLVGFAIIWAALGLFAVDSASHARRSRPGEVTLAR
jgi:chloramphenicol-sensitive protein RarD